MKRYSMMMVQALRKCIKPHFRMLLMAVPFVALACLVIYKTSHIADRAHVDTSSASAPSAAPDAKSNESDALNSSTNKASAHTDKPKQPTPTATASGNVSDPSGVDQPADAGTQPDDNSDLHDSDNDLDANVESGPSPEATPNP